MRLLKIESLPKSKQWIDRDYIMLHACFQLLKDCVEKENLLNDAVYESHKDFADEAKFLYDWWMERKDDEEYDNDDEDNEMLARLVKIRLFLWT